MKYNKFILVIVALVGLHKDVYAGPVASRLANSVIDKDTHELIGQVKIQACARIDGFAKKYLPGNSYKNIAAITHKFHSHSAMYYKDNEIDYAGKDRKLLERIIKEVAADGNEFTPSIESLYFQAKYSKNPIVTTTLEELEALGYDDEDEEMPELEAIPGMEEEFAKWQANEKISLKKESIRSCIIS